MNTLTGRFAASGDLFWQFFPEAEWHEEKGLSIHFPIDSKLKERKAFDLIREGLQQDNIEWLVFKKDKWILKSKILRNEVESLRNLEWL